MANTGGPSSDDPQRSGFYEGMEVRRNDEYGRLRRQHNLHKIVLENKLIRAPLPTDKEIQILDSGTCDGTWMVDAHSQYPNATFVGTDINPKHFEALENKPSYITFKKQNLLEPWPQDEQGKYDFVHQRYCLAQFNQEKDVEIIKGLLSLIKPGGYIQFVEADMTSFDKGPEHKGMQMFTDFIATAFPKINMYPSPGPRLKGWLEEVGAADVKEQIFTFKMGAAATDPEFRQATVENIADIIDNMAMVASKMPNYWYSQDQFKELKKEVMSEMENAGNTWKFWLVTARKV